jgi:hypothetical protein
VRCPHRRPGAGFTVARDSLSWQDHDVTTVTAERATDHGRRHRLRQTTVLVVAALAVLIGGGAAQRWRTTWAPFPSGNGVGFSEVTPGLTVRLGSADALDEPVDILSADVAFDNGAAVSSTTVAICPVGVGALLGAPGPDCTPAVGHRLAPGQQLVAVVTIGTPTPARSPGVRLSFRRGWRSGTQIVGPEFSLGQP